MQTQPIIISLEGNIGAGKSTIFNKLQQYYSNNPKVVFIKEPVDIWSEIKDEKNDNILVNYYRDPQKYAFGFQTMVYATQYKLYLDTIKENPDCKLIISERSMDAARNVFAKLLKQDNHIDEIHFKIYDMLYNMNKYNLNYVFYIDVKVDICHDRITTRSRDGENEISLDYLTKCNEFYVDWLYNKNDLNEFTSVFSFNGNENDNGEKCCLDIIEFLNYTIIF